MGIIGIGPRSGFIALLAAAALDNLEPIVALGPFLSLQEELSEMELPMHSELYPFGLFTASSPQQLVELITERPFMTTDVWGNEDPDEWESDAHHEQEDQVCHFFLSQLR